jgi:O-antigen ligase
LWRAAVVMFLERPLVGSGPDTFRRLHGSYLGLSRWNQGIYANNLYLELLATTGLAGVLAFSWVALAALRRLARVLTSSADRSVGLWSIGMGASLLVFLLHGLLDYFLWSTSVSWLFWMLLGLIVAITRVQGSTTRPRGL